MPIDPALSAAPNLWGFLMVLCQVAGTAFTGWLAYRIAIKPKIQEIHTLVNGNLHTALRKVDELRARLTEHGIDAD